MASFMSPRFDPLGVSARSNSQVPDVLTVVVLSKVDLSLSEGPACPADSKMGDADLLSFRSSIKPPRHMMPRLL